MTVKEVYEIVKGINEKLDHAIDTKVNKDICKEKHSNTNKLVWGLFGVNIFGIIALIFTIVFKV